MLDEYLAMLADALGVNKAPGAPGYNISGKSPPAPTPSAYLGDPNPVKQAMPAPNVTAIPNWKNQPESTRQLFTQNPSAPDYQRPDPFEHGEDIIALLSEAEKGAGLSAQPSGIGNSRGGVDYSTQHLGNRKLSEDDALEYIKFLSEGR